MDVLNDLAFSLFNFVFRTFLILMAILFEFFHSLLNTFLTAFLPYSIDLLLHLDSYSTESQTFYGVVLVDPMCAMSESP